MYIVSTSLQNGGVSSPPKIENGVSDGFRSLCPCVPLPLSPRLSTDERAITLKSQYTFDIDWRQKNHCAEPLYMCTHGRQDRFVPTCHAVGW